MLAGLTKITIEEEYLASCFIILPYVILAGKKYKQVRTAIYSEFVYTPIILDVVSLRTRFPPQHRPGQLSLMFNNRKPFYTLAL